MSNTGHKNITRVDHEECRMYGYLVRVMWKGEMYQKWFADGVYGDRVAQEAIDWRDKIERQIGKPRTERQIRSSGFIVWLNKHWVRHDQVVC
jgi:hypothetical protein